MAVHDVAPAAELFRDVLGAEFLMGGNNTEQAFRWVQYRFPGGGKIELVTPLGEGFVSRFLNKRGEGVHHLTFKAGNLPEQVTRLRSGGVEPVQVSLDDPHWREAFIHPRQAHGVLIQIAESFHEDEEVSRRHLEHGLTEAVLLGAEATPGA